MDDAHRRKNNIAQKVQFQREIARAGLVKYPGNVDRRSNFKLKLMHMGRNCRTTPINSEIAARFSFDVNVRLRAQGQWGTQATLTENHILIYGHSHGQELMDDVYWR